MTHSKPTCSWRLTLGALALALPLLSGCPRSEPEPEPTKAEPTDHLGNQPGIVFAQPVPKDSDIDYSADIMHQGAEQLALALQQAERLALTVTEFAEQPSSQGFAQLKQQSQQLETQLLAASPWLFGEPPRGHGPQPASAILHWPGILPFLDSTSWYPFGGILGDQTVPLTEESLRFEHQVYNLEELALGIGAIRLLLEGDADNPKDWQDFAETPDHPILAERRRRYLQLVSQLLVQDLGQFSQAWQQASAEPLPPSQALAWQQAWRAQFQRYWQSLPEQHPQPELPAPW